MSSSTDPFQIPPRPSQSLEGRVAIVTGAGSRANGIGNGRAASILLAEAGANVVCLDMNSEWADVTISMIEKEFGQGRAVSLQGDVTKESDCKRAVETALGTYGRLDILVNNVGIGGPDGTAVDVDPAQWAKGLEVNVTSMMLMTKYAVPAMERNSLHPISGRGNIVNISSVAGLMGGTSMLLHAPSGIRVNCVCPGMLYTPMLYSGGMTDDVRAARRDCSLLKTEGNGWDCGCAVRFFASDQARWMTGVILPVDAGSTAAPAGEGMGMGLSSSSQGTK
ncbi:short-chain dehydrogenase/reductase SDR [Pholiota conissans]|uniref:Short-chain dehydrogenase/reductase SDR n=1 Tax=Pholiota conissans TaxID=109636 RepID=A0A9P6D3F0_9AGAR|nr:short-chain dehydrogenase/reductase SDR [Pholiota conissans]